jgi:hypothetical protein
MKLPDLGGDFKKHSAFIEQSVQIGPCSHALAQAVLIELSGWINWIIHSIDEY